MMGINLHNLVGSALYGVNPWKKLTFTHTKVEWSLSSRDPIETKEQVEVMGKLQPASEQTIMQLGFNVREYQYFRGYVSHKATQIDRILSLGCDTFECDGLIYRIVGKKDWIQNGWRCFWCYVDKKND